MIQEYLCKGPPLTKDKGYVWFILMMAFVSNFAHLGFVLGVLGNLTIAHKQLFNIDLQTSSLIGSLNNGVFLIFGPVSSAIVKKLGCRTTELLGGVCMILGIGLSSLSTELWHVFLLLSALTGVGLSLCMSACTEILAQHFNKYRHLAFSTASMGAFVGAVVWPIMSQYLLDKYGYSKAMGIMASLHVVHIIAGISFFPPNNCDKAETKACSETADDSTYVNEAYVTNDGGGSVESVEQEIDNKIANIPKVCQEDNIPSANPSYFPPNNNVTDETKACAKTADDSTHVNEAYVTNDGGGSVERVEQKIDGNIANIHKVCQDDDIEIRDNQQSETDLKKDFLALAKSYKVWLLFVYSITWNATGLTVIVTINNYIITRTGINITDAAFGVTITAIAAIAGSVGVSLTSTLIYDRLILHTSSIFLLSTTTIFLAMANTKAVYYVLTAIWGVSQGVLVSTLVSVMNDCCGARQQALLFGIISFSKGIGGLGGSQIYVYIGTVAGDIYGLISAGIVGILANVLMIPLIISNVRSSRESEENGGKFNEPSNTRDL